MKTDNVVKTLVDVIKFLNIVTPLLKTLVFVLKGTGKAVVGLAMLPISAYKLIKGLKT